MSDSKYISLTFTSFVSLPLPSHGQIPFLSFSSKPLEPDLTFDRVRFSILQIPAPSFFFFP